MDVKLITMLLAVIALIATIYFVAKTDADSNEQLTNLETYSDTESDEEVENFDSLPAGVDENENPQQQPITSATSDHSDLVQDRNDRQKQAPNMPTLGGNVAASQDSDNSGPATGVTPVTNWTGEQLDNEDGDDEVLNYQDGENVRESDGVENPFNEANQGSISEEEANRRFDAREQELIDLRNSLNNPDAVASDNEILIGTDALAASSKGFSSVSSIGTSIPNSSTDIRGDVNVKQLDNFFAPFNNSSWAQDNLQPKIPSQNWCN